MAKPEPPEPPEPIRRKADEDRHETPFNLKVTAGDREAFQVAADAEGLPPTVWARGVLRREARRVALLFAKEEMYVDAVTVPKDQRDAVIQEGRALRAAEKQAHEEDRERAAKLKEAAEKRAEQKYRATSKPKRK